MNPNQFANDFARIIQERMSQTVNTMVPADMLDFGIIQDDYSLQTNLFKIPIPAGDYYICRSVSYNPKKPLTRTWWKEEGVIDTTWEDEIWDDTAWGKLSDPEDSEGRTYWEAKHTDDKIKGAIEHHDHGDKGDHDHDQDGDGKHFHDIYLPKAMHWLKPGDKVVVLWIQNEAVVVDIVCESSVFIEEG